MSVDASMDAQAGFNEWDVAERIVRNKLEIERLQKENGELTQFFRQDETGTRKLMREGKATFFVKVTGNSRIDDKLASSVLDADTYTYVSKRVIDSAKARAFLEPDTLRAITKQFDNKVEVGLE